MAANIVKRRSFRIMKLDNNNKTESSTSSQNFRSGSIYKKKTHSDGNDGGGVGGGGGGGGGGGILHQIPDIEIPEINFTKEYDIEKTLAEGCFAKIFLATHRPTQTTVVLKAVHVELTNLREFIKEFHYSYQLSHHPSILSSYNVAFQTKDYYLFAQECAPYGDLASNVGPNGLHESSCKLIAEQLCSALGFMHSKNLVHRDLKLENVLVFSSDFTRIKLCDFGATTRKGALVNKIQHTWISFLPPEILEIVKNERFICKTSADSWQFGILLYSILMGTTPWQLADWVKDSHYSAFMKYQKKKTTKIPDNFRKFSPRLIRCFRKYLDPDEENRAKVTEITKYLKDRWINMKLTSSKSATVLSTHHGARLDADQDSVCVYLNQHDSKYSLDENKTRLRRLMTSYGLETTIDQTAVRNRIWEWLSSCEDNCDDVEGF